MSGLVRGGGEAGDCIYVSQIYEELVTVSNLCSSQE